MPVPVQSGQHSPSRLESGIADESNILPNVKPTQDPFGDEDDATVKYKTMTWWQAGMIMIAETISLGILALPKETISLGILALPKETISLGILALPKALSILGLLPGILTILFIGIISSYTGYTIGQFKTAHPEIHTMADAGNLLMGKTGRRILGIEQINLLHLRHGKSHPDLLNNDERSQRPLKMHNPIFLHQPLTFLLTNSTPTSGTTIPPFSPNKMVMSPIPLLPTKPTVHDVCLAIANVIFAYAGHIAFFTLFSELKHINDFPKALGLLQMSEMIMYTITATVIYVFVGPSITSPALNLSGILFRKISYGIAIPTIVIGGVINAHVAVKYIYVHLDREKKAMHTRTFRARATWAGICGALWLVSWLIAEGIPIFNDILGLASSVFASWFSFGLPGLFCLYINRQADTAHTTRKQRVLYCINILLVFFGFAICVMGLYSSIQSIARNLREDVGGGSFSCKDNSIY